jgi:hypothetical protein
MRPAFACPNATNRFCLDAEAVSERAGTFGGVQDFHRFPLRQFG